MTYSDKVGGLAEDAVQGFLASGGFTVIPYGIEHTLKVVADLDLKQYAQLQLDEVIATAPDFFVLSPERQYYWLLEVKYRSFWSDETRDWLKSHLEPQVKCWRRMLVLIAIKSPVGTPGAPESHIRVGQLFVENGKLSVYAQTCVGGKEWDQVQWEDLPGIGDVFSACCSNTGGLEQLCNLIESIRSMPDDDHTLDVSDKRKVLEVLKKLHPPA